MNPTEPISVEQIAISNAKSLFGKLKDGDQLFQSCISQTASISQLIQYVNETNCSHKRKTSSKLLEQFQRNTEGLQSFSYAIELAVQAKADIFCPLWAPVKLILQVGFWCEITHVFATLQANHYTTDIQISLNCCAPCHSDGGSFNRKFGTPRALPKVAKRSRHADRTSVYF